MGTTKPEPHRAGRLRIGTRGSALALAQSRQTAERLSESGVDSELIVVRTSGDRITDVPLAKVGGKGLFIKELEEALANRQIDLAIHSMKDVPAVIPAGFAIAAVTARADPSDVLILPEDLSELPEGSTARGEESPLDALRSGSRVGTGSLRRCAQIAAYRSDVSTVPIRGNVDTRIEKLRRGEVDALVLAAAGLARLGSSVRRRMLPCDAFLPAPGQGALALEARADDTDTQRLVQAVHDDASAAACTAERAFLRELGATCVVPVAAFATIEQGELRLDGLVASLDGSRVLRDQVSGPASSAAVLGATLAARLIAVGAREILDEIERTLAH